MDFIFMLTRDDRTIDDCLEVIDITQYIGLKHIGFKDVGVDRDTLVALSRRVKECGAISYLEVVSTTSEAARDSIRMAVDIGVDRICGGKEVAFAMDLLKGTRVEYLPFVGKPIGHPTRLAGTPEDVAADCAVLRAAGCAGVDLLAYRSTEAEPLDLIRAARAALDGGYLMVAGGIDSPERIRAVAEAGANGFTVGSAIFNGSFSAHKGSILSQLADVQRACVELHSAS
ncbi:4-hydroxythreonine-4-phosphate dehydrogenase [Bradyrhizobium tropiciagri]|uniref:HisA/HisF-related TIM barrel protein n=1 Tax=Bradyrhizobium tropiciagri TaxID=312253 RepID=UPI001BABF846|nr:HisA/HisF-related TIM barrel protein [Bradyrhizobium tropiciagri]MBR0898993.1 4-hydroxythreonine-4-phosphate dehydrogenase [Bradyrhizobium tropiciagri]